MIDLVGIALNWLVCRLQPARLATASYTANVDRPSRQRIALNWLNCRLQPAGPAKTSHTTTFKIDLELSYYRLSNPQDGRLQPAEQLNTRVYREETKYTACMLTLCRRLQLALPKLKNGQQRGSRKIQYLAIHLTHFNSSGYKIPAKYRE